MRPETCGRISAKSTACIRPENSTKGFTLCDVRSPTVTGTAATAAEPTLACASGAYLLVKAKAKTVAAVAPTRPATNHLRGRAEIEENDH